MLRKIEIRSNDVSQVNCFKEKYSLQMCFIKRHPEVSVRATEKFGRARTSVSAEDVAPFYDKLLETLTSNKYGYNFFAMKQPWNLMLFRNLFALKRAKNLFLVIVVECTRKFQYFR